MVRRYSVQTCSLPRSQQIPYFLNLNSMQLIKFIFFRTLVREVNDCKKDQTEMKRHSVSKATIQLIVTRRSLTNTGGLRKPFKNVFFFSLMKQYFRFKGFKLSLVTCTKFSLDLLVLRSQVAENNSEYTHKKNRSSQ